MIQIRDIKKKIDICNLYAKIRKINFHLLSINIQNNVEI